MDGASESGTKEREELLVLALALRDGLDLGLGLGFVGIAVTETCRSLRLGDGDEGLAKLLLLGESFLDGFVIDDAEANDQLGAALRIMEHLVESDRSLPGLLRVRRDSCFRSEGLLREGSNIGVAGFGLIGIDDPKNEAIGRGTRENAEVGTGLTEPFEVLLKGLGFGNCHSFWTLVVRK